MEHLSFLYICLFCTHSILETDTHNCTGPCASHGAPTSIIRYYYMLIGIAPTNSSEHHLEEVWIKNIQAEISWIGLGFISNPLNLFGLLPYMGPIMKLFIAYDRHDLINSHDGFYISVWYQIHLTGSWIIILFWRLKIFNVNKLINLWVLIITMNQKFGRSYA